MNSIFKCLLFSDDDEDFNQANEAKKGKKINYNRGSKDGGNWTTPLPRTKRSARMATPPVQKNSRQSKFAGDWTTPSPFPRRRGRRSAEMTTLSNSSDETTMDSFDQPTADQQIDESYDGKYNHFFTTKNNHLYHFLLTLKIRNY